ncbi:MAG TPA: glycosyltransferase family 9 protein [Pirellulales bacterium]|nr:glycosyltransferase family 9 protein [Pirellulales bacterium]
MSLTRQIHERLIADGLMARSPSPERCYASGFGGLPQPPVAIDPPADASAVLRVRCAGASGDVLLACAVAGALKVERPGCYVILETARPQVACRNPFIDAVVPMSQPLAPRERLIDTFDLRPEARWQPRRHRLRQFAEAAGVALESLRFFIHTEPLDAITRAREDECARARQDNSLAPSLPRAVAHSIVLHPGPTENPEWKGRNWLPERWDEVARRLAEEGHSVVIVGSRRATHGESNAREREGATARDEHRHNTVAPSPTRAVAPSSRILDLQGQTTLYQLAHLITHAKLFVGIESLPAIIAQALGVPAVLFFGSVAPELRVFRDNVIAVTAPGLRCLGCHHDEPLPTITYRCRVGGEPCQSRVTVEMMLDAVRAAEPLTRAPRTTRVVLREPTERQPPPIKLTPHSALRIPHSPIVLLRRENGDGDVLVASSVAAAVKKRFPRCRVVFETVCPKLLKAHPYIDEIVAPGWQGHRDMLADMNVSCENLPYTNMLAVYASRAAVSPEECEFFIHTEPIYGLPDEYAVMHLGPPGAGKRAWVGRAWFDDRFLAVARYLAERGLSTVLVGTDEGARARVGEGAIQLSCRPFAPSPARALVDLPARALVDLPPRALVDLPPRALIDLRGKTTLYQLAYVIAQARLFVGIDSLPFHIAQAFNVPGVAFFGSIRPELRIYRENMHGVSASELSCIGCHHDRRTVFPEPPETSLCRIGHEHCRSAVTVRRFIEAVEAVLGAANCHQQGSMGAREQGSKQFSPAPMLPCSHARTNTNHQPLLTSH